MKFIAQLVEFIFVTVIFKAIIVHALANYILKYGEKWFKMSERHMTIWAHYQAQAYGLNHSTKSVKHCSEGKCAII